MIGSEVGQIDYACFDSCVGPVGGSVHSIHFWALPPSLNDRSQVALLLQQAAVGNGSWMR